VAHELVLVVEDDRTLRRVLKDNFEFQGYRVATAEDGEEGLEAARQAPPDLIILDIMLPGINGYEVCRLLRQDGMDVPIIMLTAKGEEPDVLLGLEVGADDYVKKPFSLNELLARANGMVRRHGAATRRTRDYEERLREFAEQVRVQERSLQRAREFQESLMGRPEPCPGWEVGAGYRFCSTMGGDFYDILDVGDARTGLLLADVSGHGADAALVTGMLKVQLVSNEHLDEPAGLIRSLNASLFPLLSQTAQFLTLIYATVSGKTGEVRYASAGHNPLVVTRRGSGVDEFGSTGPPVGMMEEMPLETVSLSAEPGDAVWLYTDGLFEPATVGTSRPGRKWLIEVILRARRRDLGQWVGAVLEEAERATRRSEVDDDMAVIAACRLPPPVL
jgi:sigma-B regulation protein RsbU (phosphoserine phosphatase)